MPHYPDYQPGFGRKIWIKGLWSYLVLLLWFFGSLYATIVYADDERLSVFVSIVPQQYFLEQIGGGLVDIRVMVAPGASPHTYEPKPRQLMNLAKARLYFSIGVPFEKVWLPKLSAANTQMTIVPTDRGITKRIMTAELDHEGQTGAHEDAHKAEDGTDPHIWLAPPLARIQAGHIVEALIMADPRHSAEYKANYQAFVDVIDRLDADLRRELAPFQHARFMVFHPSWGYFADTYDLVQIPIEVDGKEPKPAQLQQLIKEGRELGIKAILVQPQFSSKSARVIAEALAGRVVVADPMASDWAENLRRIVRQLQIELR